MRCGLLLVPQAAIERLKAEGAHTFLCFNHFWANCTHMLVAQSESFLLNISHLSDICASAGLEGAKGTAWKSLAASEKVALAFAFIHEEDGALSSS